MFAVHSLELMVRTRAIPILADNRHQIATVRDSLLGRDRMHDKTAIREKEGEQQSIALNFPTENSG
jgi:hypothetical protein